MSIWGDDPEEPRTRTRDDDGFMPDNFAQMPVRYEGSSDTMVATLIRTVQEQGERDLARMLERAEAEGARLGRLPGREPGSNRAEYRWKQGKGTVEGPTIDLMLALAGVWGRLWWRIELVERRGRHVRLNVRVADVFVGNVGEYPYDGLLLQPRSKFADGGEQAARWDAMQMGVLKSKALRGALEDVIPDWLTQAARIAARASQAKELTGGNLPAAVAGALKWFGSGGTTAEELAAYLGKPPADWTVAELAKLRDIKIAYQHGELTQAQVGALIRAGEQPEEQQEPEEPSPPSEDRLASVGLGETPPPSPGPAASGGPAPSTSPTDGKQTKPPVDPAQVAARANVALVKRTRNVGIPWTKLVETFRACAERDRLAQGPKEAILEAGVAAGYWSWNRTLDELTLLDQR